MAPGYASEQSAIVARLGRVEGQVRGISRMVSEEQYCIDVLTQIAAATRALQSVAVTLLSGHLGHCVAEAVAADGPHGPVSTAKLAEATKAIERLVRS